jgi:hypothetical protein
MHAYKYPCLHQSTIGKTKYQLRYYFHFLCWIQKY